ncbi:amidase [Flindersiella endophytica]
MRAFVAEPDRRGRLRTEAAQAPDGPLNGVPVGVKDVFHADGLETRAGSELPPELLTGPEAVAVRRLKQAGALVAGKTVTAEFAFQAPGPTVNPHDPTRTPGGSSSGSAAAVAVGLVPVALGTQTIGSVIRPAAYCGVFGFKPSYGRIPVDGVIANAPSLDTVGVLAADLEIAERAAAALCDDWTPAPPPGRAPRLAVPDGPYLRLATEAALVEFDKRLGRLGEIVRRVPALSDIDVLIDHNTTLNLYEIARVHEVWFETHAERYRTQTADGIRRGRELSADDHKQAQRAKAGFARSIAAQMDEEGVDAWIAPSATGPAPDLSTTGSTLMNLPWTFAGLPVVGIPAGEVGGLPVGVQLVGRPGSDERLLGWARQVAEAIQG